MPIDEVLGWAWIAWIGLVLLFGVIEMLTLDFVFLMLALGSLGGLVSGLLSAPWWAQIIVAAVLAVLLLLFVRPALLRRLHRGADPAKSNIDAVIGISGRAVGDFVEGRGLVRLANGETWTARTPATPGTDPLDGEPVVVRSIEGATAVVAPVTESEHS